MKRKRIIKVMIVIVAAFVIIAAAFIILNGIIQKKIRRQLTQLSPAIQVKFSAIHSNFFSSSISFDSLRVSFIPYKNMQQNQHRLLFTKASLKGISVLKILFNKQLVAADLLLENGNIRLDQFLIDKKDSAQSEVLKEIEW